MSNNFIKTIQEQLLINWDSEHQKVLQRYMKWISKFYGLRSPQITEIFRNLYREIKLFSIQEQINLAFELFDSDIFEDKCFATMILHKLVKKHLDVDFLDNLKSQIEKNIYDWANCDVLSSRVNTNIVIKYPEAAQKIVERKDSKFMRLQRSACVSFVRLGKTWNYNEEIVSICSTTIQNPERFVQLGTGWVLRELSLSDLKLVEWFIKDNYKYFSREWLRYAVEKMHPEKKIEILQYNK